MTDEKPIEEMRLILKRVEDRRIKDNIGVYEACEREGVSKTTYYAYKLRVERHDKMMQTPQQPPTIETPEYPTITREEKILPEKQKYPIEKHRISIDLPNDVYDCLEKERKEGTLTVKGMCQKIIISYVRDKMNRYEPLFK